MAFDVTKGYPGAGPGALGIGRREAGDDCEEEHEEGDDIGAQAMEEEHGGGEEVAADDEAGAAAVACSGVHVRARQESQEGRRRVR